MLAARSDGSMQDRSRVPRIFPHESPVFILHRAPFGERQLESWGGDSRVIFCTTITPDSPEFRGSPIKPPQQMVGLKRLLEAGISARRISVMLGPLNSNNVAEGVKTIEELAEMDMEFLTYRGCSVGNLGIAPKTTSFEKQGFSMEDRMKI